MCACRLLFVHARCAFQRITVLHVLVSGDLAMRVSIRVCLDWRLVHARMCICVLRMCRGCGCVGSDMICAWCMMNVVRVCACVCVNAPVPDVCMLLYQSHQTLMRRVCL